MLRLILSLLSQFELSHYLAELLPKHTDIGFLVNATPQTNFIWIFLKLYRYFVKAD